MKKISIFGSTGSIGRSAVEVISANRESFKIVALAAKNNVELLAKQALELHPEVVVTESYEKYELLKSLLSDLKETKILCGLGDLLSVAQIKCDLFLSAIVGSAGMIPTLNAIRSGSNVALANKESLVCAGSFLLKEAQEKKVRIIPVDSEHNAIFQIFENENLDFISDIILTASGGPFFNSERDLSKVSVEEALKHPNWSMGKKVTIDSATMMNKGLEMIEASHFFPIQKDRIKILIHPQSIVHGMVNYEDGSNLAVLSVPDMRVPISYALSYPKRMSISHKKLDLARLQNLTFFEPDEKKFPAIKLCRDAMNVGGSAPVVLNAANEVAVEKFLSREISFAKITEIVALTLEKIPNKRINSVEEVLELDVLARNLARSL